MLLLDEPNGLDAASADRFLTPLHTLSTGRTTVLISHDLRTVRDADQILYLDGGRVTAAGTHDQLLRSSTGYAHLYRLWAATRAGVDAQSSCDGLPEPGTDMTSPASDRPQLDPPPTPPRTQLAAGYEVLEHVCRGEELDSFEAWSTDRHCRCFIKTLRPDYATDPAARRHLRQEAQILLALSHPHIARAYEFVQPADGAAPLLVCENLIGATLGYLLETEGRLGHADLGNLGQQLCSALRYLHERGFLHLDIKPSNIIASYGLARLIDFSLARPPGHVRRGVGTLGYMSPEQAVGGELGTATDVWGLGATLTRPPPAHPPSRSRTAER